tara:strand:+ start:342 stop:1289 length:948 start_codon:yes stop_codon:yes gene_type:complete
MNLSDPKEVERVGLLGTGTIGASWAAYFLSRGLEVIGWDPAPDAEKNARSLIERAWPAIEALGPVSNANPDQFRFVNSVIDCVTEVQFIQENAPENLDVKRDLFRTIDKSIPPDTILASSTSGLLISEMQFGLNSGSRYVLGHPFNPPHILPLVEVLGGNDTDATAVDWTIEFYKLHGKKAVKLEREVLGHVVDRLQVAMYREAIHLVNSGVASAKVVDEAITYGPGLRWALMGPLMVSHLAGGQGGIKHFLEHIGPGIEKWWEDLGNPRLTPDVIDRISDSVEEEAGQRSISDLEAERDTKLIAILNALNTSEQ